MHTLELTTDEVEALRELLDGQYDERNPGRQTSDELDEIRYKIAVIREEPLSR